MTQNEHIYAIYCRPEVDDGSISSENVKTLEGYAVVNLEVVSSTTIVIFTKIIS